MSLHKWQGGAKFKFLYLFSKTIVKKKCSLHQTVNSFGEILDSGFRVALKDGEKK